MSFYISLEIFFGSDQNLHKSNALNSTGDELSGAFNILQTRIIS